MTIEKSLLPEAKPGFFQALLDPLSQINFPVVPLMTTHYLFYYIIIYPQLLKFSYYKNALKSLS